MTFVKMCGMRTAKDVAAAAEAGADAVGMVLTPGFGRSVAPADAAEMVRLIPGDTESVGVFVDSPQEYVVSAAEKLGLGMIQLHGSEDGGYIGRIQKMTGLPVIKSFIVRSREDLAEAEGSGADFVLLDSGKGSGRTLDWEALGPLGRRTVLAGGLTPENVEEAISKARPFAVDVSSGIETDGIKDPDKMRKFVEAAAKAGREE